MKGGTVRAWGYNVSGQLGNGTTTNSSTPVQVTGLTSATAITASGSGTSVYALLQDGTLRTWGYNVSGQLGNGTTTNSSTPVQVSGLTSATAITANAGSSTGDHGSAYALLQDATVMAWGYNGRGSSETAPPPTATPRSRSPASPRSQPTTEPPTPCCKTEPSEAGATTPRASWETAPPTTAAPWSRSPASPAPPQSRPATEPPTPTQNGTVRAWGDNSWGERGNGTSYYSSTPVQVTGLTSATAITANNGTAYALLQDGTVRAWGYNGQGQLGNGTTTDSSVPVQVGVASGP